MNCCTTALADVFTEDMSRKDAERYRKRGLPGRARKLLAAVESIIAFQGHSTLEVGVGAGAVTVEMLRRGASRATGVDAVPAQLAAARALVQQYDVADRCDLVLADFAETAAIQPADIVVLDRVVCCYPDWRSLLSAAAARAGTVLVMTYPVDTWWMRRARNVFNRWQRLRRSDFRLHVHPAREMHALLELYALTPRSAGRYWGWEIVVAKHR